MSPRRDDPIEVEWDPHKANSSFTKHGVTFGEAATVLFDPLALTIPDPAHSTRELRFVTIGMTQNARLVVVVHTSRGRRIRLISARRPTAAEKKAYEQDQP